LSFLNPTALGLLFLSIPLVAIYFLKVRPRLKQTTTFFLWDELFEEKKSSALFQKLRDWLSLLLMLLVLFFIIFSISEPSFSGDNKKDYLIIVDNSASMATKGEHGMRLELAKEKARSLISAMSLSTKVSVLTLSNGLRSLQTRTSNRKSLNESIDSIETSLYGRNQSLLEHFIQNKDISKNFRVFMITDKGFDPFEGAEIVEMIKVGGHAENIGITDFDIRYSMTKSGSIDLFFRLVSTYTETKEVSLIFSHGDEEQILKVIPCTVKPGINKPEIFSSENNLPGKYTLRCEIEDALEMDNNAFAILPEIVPIKTSIIGEDRFYLEKCVTAFKGYESIMALVDREADLTLSNGIVSNENKANIVFNPIAKSSVAEVIGEINQIGLISVVNKEHPLSKIIDWENVVFKGVRKIKLPPSAFVLVSTESGDPLVYLVKTKSTSTLVVNMNPKESNFFLNPYFPMLVYASAHEMLNLKTGEPVLYRPGQIPNIGGLNEDSTLELFEKFELDENANEDGSEIKKKAFPFSKLGFIDVETPQGEKSFACSIIGKNESLINDADFKTTLKAVHMGLSPSKVLVYLALFVLVLECMLYHYRKVG